MKSKLAKECFFSLPLCFPTLQMFPVEFPFEESSWGDTVKNLISDLRKTERDFSKLGE